MTHFRMTFRAIIFLVTLTQISCMDRKVNKTLETKTDKQAIKTDVETYSKSEKRFYGKIHICNLTQDTIGFNFYQMLHLKNEVLKADYNFKPISYAYTAFLILPKQCSTWEVVWNSKEEVNDFEEIYLTADTTVIHLVRSGE